VAFIIGGMTLAALGKVPPVLAAAMHTTGSLIVVFNSARLVRKGEELEHYHPEPVTPKPPQPGPRTPAPEPELAAKAA
jgi:Cd2+/Zn2+-exporting ATPase